MERHFRGSAWSLAAAAGRARLAGIAVAAVVTALGTGAWATDASEVALVESITGTPPSVQLMDYVRTGQVIRLGPQETIVLSYQASCVREKITGGTVTVGIERSQVQSGEVTRTGGRCDPGRIVLTGAESHIAGRTFRGGPGR